MTDSKTLDSSTAAIGAAATSALTFTSVTAKKLPTELKSILKPSSYAVPPFSTAGDGEMLNNENVPNAKTKATKKKKQCVANSLNEANHATRKAQLDKKVAGKETLGDFYKTVVVDPNLADKEAHDDSDADFTNAAYTLTIDELTAAVALVELGTDSSKIASDIAAAAMEAVTSTSLNSEFAAASTEDNTVARLPVAAPTRGRPRRATKVPEKLGQYVTEPFDSECDASETKTKPSGGKPRGGKPRGKRTCKKSTKN
ncbi:hypothetical protein MPSEU_000263600 [Mayamaea pseudoterrestris]|nr:hypothetical protein MPSEU_000263600 [Mayamaea pseudoterrestris]